MPRASANNFKTTTSVHRSIRHRRSHQIEKQSSEIRNDSREQETQTQPRVAEQEEVKEKVRVYEMYGQTFN